MPKRTAVAERSDTTTADTTAGVELLLADPNDIEIDDNVRDRVDTDSQDWADLVASIGEHGVLQAVSAVRTPEGDLRLQRGQRRLLAARELGLPTVPVLVAPDTAASEKDRVFSRIVGQIDENDVRIGISDGQRAAAIAQMLDVRIPQTRIRKALRLKRDELKLHARIGKSATARAALDDGQLDLEHAAVVASFDADGDQDAVDRLLAASPYNFRYTANCILAEREDARRRAEAAEPWAEHGFTVFCTDPDHTGGAGAGEWIRLDRLTHAESGDPATVDVVDADPSKWGVWLALEEGGLVTVIETGEVIDPELVDWSTEDTDPDIAPAAGRYRVDAVSVSDAFVPEYYARATDLDALNLSVAAAGSAGGGVVEASMSQAELDAAEQRDAERAERRRVITLNRLGKAAKTTRIQWLTTYLKRKTPPTQAAGFVAESLARDSLLLNQNRGKDTAAQLLGVAPDQMSRRGGLSEFVAGLTPNRAQVIILALVLGAYEARCDKDLWRPHPYADTGIPAYLGFLQSLGYPLSPVEQIATGDRDPDDVDDDDE